MRNGKAANADDNTCRTRPTLLAFPPGISINLLEQFMPVIICISIRSTLNSRWPQCVASWWLVYGQGFSARWETIRGRQSSPLGFRRETFDRRYRVTVQTPICQTALANKPSNRETDRDYCLGYRDQSIRRKITLFMTVIPRGRELSTDLAKLTGGKNGEKSWVNYRSRGGCKTISRNYSRSLVSI